MLQINKIQNALFNLVGWRQSFDPQWEIPSSLTETESGLYFQDAHPLLTIDNIKAVIPAITTYNYPEWNATTAYKKGDRVKYSWQEGQTIHESVFVAIKNNTNETPNTSDKWEIYNFIQDYLTQQVESAIATMVQNFIQMKSLKEETKTLLERRPFFDGAGRLTNVIQNNGRLVGFQIIPVRSMGVTAKIERVGLQFIGGTGTVKLYLFHSSQIDPIKTFDVEFTKENGGFQWFTLEDCYLPYISDANNTGGVWFLCYNQDELPTGMVAINANKDWSKDPCGTCSRYGLESWRELTKYLSVMPFRIQAPTTFADYPEMWDIANIVPTNTTNYGLNCEITVGCDLTDFIIEQRQMFATVLQRQVAVNMLRTMAMNPETRVNRNQTNVDRMGILYEIDGNSQGRESGLGYELKKAYEALSLNTRGIDRICLACNNHGVRYTTA